jgi:hypothetical protein
MSYLVPGALTLEDSAFGPSFWAWAERSLYEVLGSWVVTTPAPDAKIYFDACSQHHAWRAAAWQERLPPSYLAPAQLGEMTSVGPVPAVERAMAAMAPIEGAAERLAAYVRAVLPHVVVAYGRWRSRCAPSADRPIARTLDRLLADVVADWQEGEAVLQGLLGDPQAVLAASRSASAVESLLAGQGLVPDGW